MKRISLFLALFIVSSTLLAQSRQVFEKSVYDAELDQFETYAIGDMMNLSGETYVTEGKLLSGMVEDAVEYEIDTYNYNMEKENPDMLINYMVFDQKYNDEVGYMPGFRIDEDFGMDDNILKDIKDGSMMVSTVRTKDGKAVWSGYVVDGVDPEASLREQQKDARQAISAAMEVFMAHVNFEDIPTTSVGNQ